MLNILSIDTATEFNLLSLMIDKVLVFEDSNIIFNEHAEKMICAIHKVFKNLNIEINQINIITFNNGPGNYTGIRVGSCIAKSLSLFSNIPLIQISTFESLAERCWRKYKELKPIITSIKLYNKKILWVKCKRKKNGLWKLSKIFVHSQKEFLKKFMYFGNTKYFYAGTGWGGYNLSNKNGKYEITKIKKNKIIFTKSQDIFALAMRKYRNGIFSSLNAKLKYV